MHAGRRKLEAGGKETTINRVTRDRAVGDGLLLAADERRDESRWTRWRYRWRGAPIRIFTGVIRYKLRSVIYRNEPRPARMTQCSVKGSQGAEIVRERSHPWKWPVGEPDFSWGAQRKLKIRQEYTDLARSEARRERKLKTRTRVWAHTVSEKSLRALGESYVPD